MRIERWMFVYVVDPLLRFTSHLVGFYIEVFDCLFWRGDGVWVLDGFNWDLVGVRPVEIEGRTDRFTVLAFFLHEFPCSHDIVHDILIGKSLENLDLLEELTLTIFNPINFLLNQFSLLQRHSYRQIQTLHMTLYTLIYF